MKTTIVRSARNAIAVTMAMLLVIGSPLRQVALAQEAKSSSQERYLSDVRVGMGKTVAEATKAIEGDGYAVLKANGTPVDLNQGAGSSLKSDRAVVLGYDSFDL